MVQAPDDSFTLPEWFLEGRPDDTLSLSGVAPPDDDGVCCKDCTCRAGIRFLGKVIDSLEKHIATLERQYDDFHDRVARRLEKLEGQYGRLDDYRDDTVRRFRKLEERCVRLALREELPDR